MTRKKSCVLTLKKNISNACSEELYGKLGRGCNCEHTMRENNHTSILAKKHGSVAKEQETQKQYELNTSYCNMTLSDIGSYQRDGDATFMPRTQRIHSKASPNQETKWQAASIVAR